MILNFSCEENTLLIQPTLIERIKESQQQDLFVRRIVAELESSTKDNFVISGDGTLYVQRRLVVPEDKGIRESLLGEAHKSMFSIHPGSTKMYRDLKEKFWWN